MKIAFFTFSILEHGGGLEKYFIDTASNLTSHYSDMEISIVTCDENMNENLIKVLSFYYFKRIDKSKIYREQTSEIQKKLGGVKYVKCSSFSKLKLELKKYDLIYSKNELLEAFILKFLIGYKNISSVIFGVHTPHLYPKTKSIQSKLHNMLYGSYIYNFLASGVTCFHVSNEASLNYLKKQFNNKKVIMIPYPFNIRNFQNKIKNYKIKFRFLKDKFNIVWIGRLTEQKGINELIKIIEILNRSKFYTKINWNIIGDGEDEEKIIEFAKKWGNVNFLGFIENNYIPSLLSKQNLFISTSGWEVSPFNIIEAQSLDLPVVAFNIPGPNDIINNNQTGLLVNTDEEFITAIEKILEQKIKFKNISINIQKKFNPDNIYKNLIKLFKDAI